NGCPILASPNYTGGLKGGEELLPVEVPNLDRDFRLRRFVEHQKAAVGAELDRLRKQAPDWYRAQPFSLGQVPYVKRFRRFSGRAAAQSGPPGDRRGPGRSHALGRHKPLPPGSTVVDVIAVRSIPFE